MRSSDDTRCGGGLHLSQEERDSVSWLMEVLDKIGKNPKSCNRRKAAIVASVLNKMRGAIHSMHSDLHIADDQISAMVARESEFNSMVTEFAKHSSTEGLN